MHVFAELLFCSGFICWKQKRIGVISTTSTGDEESSPESQMTASYWLSFQPRHLLLLSVALLSSAMQRCSAIIHYVPVLLVQAALYERVMNLYETVSAFISHLFVNFGPT